MDLTGLTGDVIYKYGTYIFIFWVATFLIRKMWDLFEGRLKNIDDNVTENKKLNKDITVIQAQIASKLKEHDESNRLSWGKLLYSLDKLCDTMNGGNPKIKAIQSEITALKQKMEKNNK